MPLLPRPFLLAFDGQPVGGKDGLCGSTHPFGSKHGAGVDDAEGSQADDELAVDVHLGKDVDHLAAMIPGEDVPVDEEFKAFDQRVGETAAGRHAGWL